MKRFTILRDLYFGDNASEYLAQVEAKKALIVYGSDRMEKDGTIEKIKEYLKKAGVECDVFSGVEHDPSVATVKQGVEKMMEFEPDLIIGIGGGSPIDAAKAMWVFYEHPEMTFEDITKPFELPKLRNKAKFIAIATTSGTATEVTCMSIITDEKTGIKYPVVDFNITPDVAILDTTLVEKLSKSIVANTGMDALTHAIEAYTSTMSNPITDAVAMKSIEMIFDNLVKSYNGDQDARKNMHIAQNLAGMAFSNAVLGIVHSMAHKSGKIFDIPHGMINAIYLPYATKFNSETSPLKYLDIAKRLEFNGSNKDEIIEKLIDAINDLKKNMNMPMSLSEAGVNEGFFKENLKSLASTSVQDPCTGTNPRKITDEEMEELYIAAYYGR